MTNFLQPDFNQTPKPNRKRYVSVLFFVILSVGMIYGFTQRGLGAKNINVSNDDENIWKKMANVLNAANTKPEITIEKDPEYAMPDANDGRWDILLLGIRGEDGTEEAGNYLSDTIILLSQDNKTGKTTMVSIPRDLYVRIYGTKYNKINEAYAVGVLRGNALSFTRKLLSRITGVYIDNAVVVDFSSFKSIIDDLGGVDVVLDQPFSESQQWGYEFKLPAGANHLNGENALYYARSRYSSSDFDRAQRQQKIIMAVKDKVAQLNIISDPIKSLTILNALRKNIQTDLNIWDASGLVGLSKQFNETDKVKKYVISTDNLLYESHLDIDAGHIYVLLPKDDNLQGIKKFFKDILN